MLYTDTARNHAEESNSKKPSFILLQQDHIVIAKQALYCNRWTLKFVQLQLYTKLYIVTAGYRALCFCSRIPRFILLQLDIRIINYRWTPSLIQL